MKKPVKQVKKEVVKKVEPKKPVAKHIAEPTPKKVPKVEPKPVPKVEPKPEPKKAPVEAFITPHEDIPDEVVQGPQIGDKFLVDDGVSKWAGELICKDPLTYRKYHRSGGVQTTKDIEVGADAVATEMSKEEFYKRVA